MLNPFFTQGTVGEQNLVQDLINEQLKMYGVEIFYLPRKYMTENSVLREVVQSKFDLALPLEAYVDNYDQYSGAGNILSKFGIESKDEVRLIISRERFENYITPLIEDQANIKLSTRPKSGDLIWFPLDDRVYEIKDIEYAKPYYQLQNLYVYELYCELFRLEDEVIATGIEDIDNNLIGEESDGQTDDGINTIQGPTQTLTLVGSAVQAAATVAIFDGGVRQFTITNRGGGYSSVPTVVVSSAPAGGTTASGIATMIGGINVCNLNANPRDRSVQRVDIANSGAGYTVAPGVRFTGGGSGGMGSSPGGTGVDINQAVGSALSSVGLSRLNGGMTIGEKVLRGSNLLTSAASGNLRGDVLRAASVASMSKSTGLNSAKFGGKIAKLLGGAELSNLFGELAKSGTGASAMKGVAGAMALQQTGLAGQEAAKILGMGSSSKQLNLFSEIFLNVGGMTGIKKL